MMECRRSALQDWCRCSPYFYGRLGNITECGVKGMLCIAKHIDQLKAIADTTCKCYQTCDVDSYGILEEISTEVSDEFDFFGGTRFEWTLPTFPNIRLKKDVLFSSTNLLEAFGGTVNLFLGASILSGIEIIYYCTIHLFFFIFKKKNPIHF
ncbi:sodium channel protein Nach-like [Bacillus rossius redtenbacheri]|uniref:sodium channel protein Nach-like n=1 Tax=Bacillus rossius redtenbacheri TaxID=93214 RepID=UPI002FDF0809